MSAPTPFAPNAEACGSWIASSAEKLSLTMCSESLCGYRRSDFVLLAVFLLLAMIVSGAGAAPMAQPARLGQA